VPQPRATRALSFTVIALLLASPSACATRASECSAFIEEANRGQEALSKLDRKDESSLNATSARVQASNQRLQAIKFRDRKLSELQGRYIHALDELLEKLKKADERLRAAETTGMDTAWPILTDWATQKKDFDQAADESSKTIDELNDYCK
jgi:DNA repair ATPase RecN